MSCHKKGQLSSFQHPNYELNITVQLIIWVNFLLIQPVGLLNKIVFANNYFTNETFDENWCNNNQNSASISLYKYIQYMIAALNHGLLIEMNLDIIK